MLNVDVVLLTLLIVLTTAQVTIPFTQYPSCVQPLASTLPAECNYGFSTNAEATQENNCICADTAFLATFAANVYNTCGCSALEATANILVDNCALTNAALGLTAQAFIQKGDRGANVCGEGGVTSSTSAGGSPRSTAAATATTFTTSTTSGTSLPNSTPSPSTDDPSLGDRLQEKSNQIALGVGITFGIIGAILGAIGTAITLYMCCYR